MLLKEGILKVTPRLVFGRATQDRHRLVMDRGQDHFSQELKASWVYYLYATTGATLNIFCQRPGDNCRHTDHVYRYYYTLLPGRSGDSGESNQTPLHRRSG